MEGTEGECLNKKMDIQHMDNLLLLNMSLKWCSLRSKDWGCAIHYFTL